MKVKLISTSHHEYDGKHLKPGDPFEASTKDAARLKHLGRAVEAAEPEPAKSGRYSRRDMRAKD